MIILKINVIIRYTRCGIHQKKFYERNVDMNKTNLIEKVAKETGLKKKDVEAVVNASFTAIEDAILAGDKVQVVGFGTFEVKDRPARAGINPSTREAITIAASKRLSFTTGKTLKAKLNAK